MSRYDDVVMWFRRDLRAYDHAALSLALRCARRVHCVFVFDTEILDALVARADRRVEFIWSSVRELKLALERIGGGLHVLHGRARDAIPHIAARLSAGAVFANRDYEPAARARDEAVGSRLLADGRTLHLFKDQVIFDPDEILTTQGTPFTVFAPYRRAWLARIAPAYLRSWPVERHRDALAPAPESRMPTLEDLGFVPTDLGRLGLPAGTSGARVLFDEFLARIDAYQQRRDYPALHGPSYLSVHLRFGTASIRELVRAAWSHDSDGARAWLVELIWREFYFAILHHFPYVSERAFQPRREALRFPNPPGHFAAWCEARTGYPIVDAAMRQINQTGYMHNRLRMIAASFLVKDLHVDWRLGERYFAARLNDFDLAANNGNWQWVASTGCDAQPYFRILNPVLQSKKFDPEGEFIRRYLPELARVPAEYIHEPWMMPRDVQHTAGCLVGKDYPAPLVDHSHARQRTLEIYGMAREHRSVSQDIQTP
ncbi:MAG TPA: deoxyribodipyrimidine photo-lyase [Burkholderiales bacterium]|jgi:deoxyribodipyrimidine photo-lyase|nr:deoxyribodipyrimidine photo-lyase [Burkholderiales bacterium]